MLLRDVSCSSSKLCPPVKVRVWGQWWTSLGGSCWPGSSGWTVPSQVTHTEPLNSQNSFYQVWSRRPQRCLNMPDTALLCVHVLLLHIWTHVYSETAHMGHLCPRVDMKMEHPPSCLLLQQLHLFLMTSCNHHFTAEEQLYLRWSPWRRHKSLFSSVYWMF